MRFKCVSNALLSGTTTGIEADMQCWYMSCARLSQTVTHYLPLVVDALRNPAILEQFAHPARLSLTPPVQEDKIMSNSKCADFDI